MPQTDPYAAYGGSMAPPPSQSAGADPYAAYGGHAAPAPPSAASLTANPNSEGTYKMNGANGSAGIPFSNVTKAQQNGYTLDPSDEGRFNKDWAAAPGQRNMIAPASTPWWERARETVANSAIGNSLETGLPHVADALHLHPTETVNSPTYQSDRQQLIAPQYLMPGNPQGHIAGVAKGALTGAGKLTSGNSLATMGALAATGGLAAPAAPAATAMGLGMTGVGAYGVGKNAYHAGSDYYHGNDAKADEELGETLPNAALMLLPHAGKPLARVGDYLQGKGADVYDSFLRAGERAHENDVEPGMSVLKQGPGTSIGLTRKGIYQGIRAARQDVGSQIPAIASASSAEIPRSNLQSAMDDITQRNVAVQRGSGGDQDAVPRLEQLRSTVSPLVDNPGNASPMEVWGEKKNIDKNINFRSRVSPDAKDATTDVMRRQMRGALANQLYQAVPEMEEPAEQYAGLRTAEKLAKSRQYDQNGHLFSPMRILAGTGLGSASEYATHRPELSAGLGLAATAIPEIGKLPIVKTGAATGLYQMGRGLSATGVRLSNLFPPTVGAGSEGAEYGEGEQPTEEQQQHGQHGIPPAPYRLRNLAPEIIRPDAISRSKFGLGASGRDGTMIRPLGRLEAPAKPVSEPTPYMFAPPRSEAVPARSEQSLSQEVGSRAALVPRRLLEDITSRGSEAGKAAALRQARTGSYGNIAPRRVFSEPEVIPPVRPTNDQGPAKLLKPRGRRGPAK